MMHLAHTFIQSDLHCIFGVLGNLTHVIASTLFYCLSYRKAVFKCNHFSNFLIITHFSLLSPHRPHIWKHAFGHIACTPTSRRGQNRGRNWGTSLTLSYSLNFLFKVARYLLCTIVRHLMDSLDDDHCYFLFKSEHGRFVPRWCSPPGHIHWWVSE